MCGRVALSSTRSLLNDSANGKLWWWWLFGADKRPGKEVPTGSLERSRHNV